MLRVVPTAKRLAVGMAAASVLSLGVGGLAGAATPAPSTPTPALAKFNCAHAAQALARIQKAESRIAAGLPKLTAAEQKAKAAGHSKRAARIQKRINRLESAKAKTRLDKLSQAITAKCGLSTPASTGSTTLGSTAQDTTTA